MDAKIKQSYTVIMAHVIQLFYMNSDVVGLHSISNENLLLRLIDKGDMLWSSSGDAIDFYADYLYGRMLKTDFKLSPSNNRIVVDYNPNPEYSSWVRADPRRQSSTYVATALELCIGREDVLEDVLDMVIKANS